jgi:hypothetical protein
MNITVRPRPDDYQIARRFITKRMYAGTMGYWLIQTSGLLWGGLLGLGGFTLLRFVMEYEGLDSERLVWGFSMIVAAAVLLAVHRLIVRVVDSSIIYRPGGKMLRPLAFEIVDEGLACQSGATKSLFAWEDIYSVEHDGNFAYVFHDKHYATFFPRSCFSDENAYAIFVQTLRTRFDQCKANSSLNTDPSGRLA